MMKDNLEKEEAKVNKVAFRRNTALQGFRADLENMQRKIEFYFKYTDKLK
jgi:hypothetical protein